MAWKEANDLARDLDGFLTHMGNPHGAGERFVERVRGLQLRIGLWAVPVAPYKPGEPCPNCGSADGSSGGKIEAVPTEEDDAAGFARFKCGPTPDDCGWGASRALSRPLDEVATRLREVQRIATGVPQDGPRGAALHVAIESALALAEYYRIQDEGGR